MHERFEDEVLPWSHDGRQAIAADELSGVPLWRRLAHAGYYTRRLVAEATDCQLLRVRMLGPVTLRKIRAAIPHDPLAPYRDTVHVEAISQRHAVSPCDCPCGKDGCPPKHCFCQAWPGDDWPLKADCCRCGETCEHASGRPPVFGSMWLHAHAREHVEVRPPEAPAEGARMSARAWRELNSFGETADG